MVFLSQLRNAYLVPWSQGCLQTQGAGRLLGFPARESQQSFPEKTYPGLPSGLQGLASLLERQGRGGKWEMKQASSLLLRHAGSYDTVLNLLPHQTLLLCSVLYILFTPPSDPGSRPQPSSLSPGWIPQLQVHYRQPQPSDVDNLELKQKSGTVILGGLGPTGWARLRLALLPDGSPRFQRAGSRILLSPFFVLGGSSDRRFPITCGKMTKRKAVISKMT